MTSRLSIAWFLGLALLIGCGDSTSTPPPDFTSFEWTLINGDAPWEPRAGLHVVALSERFYLMGGRTPIDSPTFGASDIWADVWVSDDSGATWEKILDTDTAGHWPKRAYFQAVTKGSDMYVLGGQDFPGFPLPSTFYNDVWRSSDGIEWEQLTGDAGWEGRAGLRAVTFKDGDRETFDPDDPENYLRVDNDVWQYALPTP